MSFAVEVWGNYAMFTRPEFKVERYSYDVMTPSAAIGFLKAIYWDPGFEYVIDRIHVLNPIRHMNICKNEIENLKVKSGNVKRFLKDGTAMKGIDGNKNRIQRRNQVLCDVRYIIEAHVQNTEKAHPGKTPWRTERRIVDEIAKGKCYKQPYFGCREYTGYFAPCDEIPPCPESLRGEMEFGFMLWGKDYSNQEDVHSQYFNAVLKDGVLNVPPPGSKEIIQ
jgi:CRISPR-associated protein Cas5d